MKKYYSYFMKLVIITFLLCFYLATNKGITLSRLLSGHKNNAKNENPKKTNKNDDESIQDFEEYIKEHEKNIPITNNPNHNCKEDKNNKHNTKLNQQRTHEIQIPNTSRLKTKTSFNNLNLNQPNVLYFPGHTIKQVPFSLEEVNQNKRVKNLIGQLREEVIESEYMSFTPLKGITCTNCYSEFEKLSESYFSIYNQENKNNGIMKGLVLSCPERNREKTKTCLISEVDKVKGKRVDTEQIMFNIFEIHYNGQLKGDIFIYVFKSPCLFCINTAIKIEKNYDLNIYFFYVRKYSKNDISEEKMKNLGKNGIFLKQLNFNKKNKHKYSKQANSN